MLKLNEASDLRVKKLRPSGMKTTRKGGHELRTERRTEQERRTNSRFTETDRRSEQDRRALAYEDPVAWTISVLSSETALRLRRKLDLTVAQQLEETGHGKIVDRLDDGAFSFEMQQEPMEEEIDRIRQRVNDAANDHCATA